MIMEEPEKIEIKPIQTPVPWNATIREELIKCGKKNCSRCPHGIFLYAYWREGGRLKKRYLGKKRSE